MEENSSHGQTASVSPSKLVAPVASPAPSIAPPKDVAAPKASLTSAVAAAFPKPAESVLAVAENPALSPLQAMQRQFSLLNMDGKLWLVDRFSIDRLTAQGVAAKLSLSNREDGALLIRRALKAQFPKIDTRSVLSEFWDSPETICNSGIEFNPAGTSEHYLNLWVGPTIFAKQGSWTLIAAFFLEALGAFFIYRVEIGYDDFW
jgi:hypothetical protein